ncbi:MAG: O-antigen ligase family protein [Nitrospira sp.]
MNSLYRNTLAVFAVLVFYCNLHEYLHEVYQVGVPWHWVLAFIILSLPLLAGQVMTSAILQEPIVVWCFGYVWVTLVWFMLGSQSEMSWQEVRWRVLAVFEILGFLAIFMDAQASKFAQLTLVIAVHIGTMINIYELFVPMSFSHVVGRSAGLYVNSNSSAEALVLGMILGATALPTWYRSAFILLVGAGVFVTYSRAGLIGWLIAVGGLILGRFIGSTHLVRTGLIALFLIGFVLLPKADQILITLDQAGSLNADTQERLAWFINPLGVDDRSGWSRKSVAREAWERVAEHPFLGGGTGAVHQGLEIPPHNLFLSHMIDHGVLGVMLMPLLLVALIWRAEGEGQRMVFIFSCVILWFCFFTHSLLNYVHSLLLMALVSALAIHRDRRRDQAGGGRLTAHSGRWRSQTPGVVLRDAP